METCNIHLMSTELFSGLVKKSFFASLSCFFDQLRHSFIKWLLHLKNILGVCFVRKILWYLKSTFFFIKGKLYSNWTHVNCISEHFRNSYEKLTQTLNFKKAHLSFRFFFFAHVCFIIWANFFNIIFFFSKTGDLADLIFVFFDPIGQALCKRTLNIVEELSNHHSEIMRFYLSKADEAGDESDRQVHLSIQIENG